MSIDLNFKKDFKNFKLDVRFKADDDVIALFGASGCGKSLTLKCIAGIHDPDEGHIIINGRVLFDSEKKINLLAQERKVGLLFQNYALFPNMTVERNIACGLRGKLSAAQRKEKVRALIDMFYLNGLEMHHPEQISGGQQQRTALARIFAGEPEILMLDEPLSALDAYLRWQLEQELITTLSNFGKTTLFVSHNHGEVYRVCDKVVVMEDGKSGAIQDVKALFRSPRSYTAAMLSGCKNFSRATARDTHTLWAEDWQTLLTCDRNIPQNIRFVGVQSDDVLLSTKENRLNCRIERITEDISNCVLSLMPIDVSRRTDQSAILMTLEKSLAGQFSEGDTISVGISRNDILLLE